MPVIDIIPPAIESLPPTPRHAASAADDGCIRRKSYAALLEDLVDPSRSTYFRRRWRRSVVMARGPALAA
jgi:hypothetical protein